MFHHCYKTFSRDYVKSRFTTSSTLSLSLMKFAWNSSTRKKLFSSFIINFSSTSWCFLIYAMFSKHFKSSSTKRFKNISMIFAQFIWTIFLFITIRKRSILNTSTRFCLSWKRQIYIWTLTNASFMSSRLSI